MKAIVQRVQQARVAINQKVIGEIGHGLLVYLAIHRDDEPDATNYLVNKLVKLRLFADESKAINQSVQAVNGEILVVSQFTLYGDTHKQNRPSFTKSAPPDQAEPIYNKLVNELKSIWAKTQSGRFAADMQVYSVNDGPVTVILPSP
jgi:D-tyrosyl-tRNA(Tyr) deacylase